MLEAGSGVPLDGGEHEQQALVAFGKGPKLQRPQHFFLWKSS